MLSRLLLACLFIVIPFITGFLITTPKDTDRVTIEKPWSLLVDTDSGTFTLDQLRDKPTLLSFFFITCGNACPIQTAKLSSVQRSLPDNVKDSTQFISVSINPLDDTVSGAKAYAQLFNIDSDHWRFAIPRSADGLSALLKELGIDAKPGASGTIDHSTNAYLVMPNGEIIQSYIGDKFQERQLLQDLINIAYLPEERE